MKRLQDMVLNASSFCNCFFCLIKILLKVVTASAFFGSLSFSNAAMSWDTLFVAAIQSRPGHIELRKLTSQGLLKP
jgi:hypothetical protein